MRELSAPLHVSTASVSLLPPSVFAMMDGEVQVAIKVGSYRQTESMHCQYTSRVTL